MCTDITFYGCVTCTYSGVDMHPDHSHHTFMFHKYHGKYPSNLTMQGNRQSGYGVVPLCCTAVSVNIQPISFHSFFLSLVLKTQHNLFFLSLISLYVSRNYEYVTERTQARPFEDESYRCSQRGANLCGANARPSDELSLARGGGGEQHV